MTIPAWAEIIKINYRVEVTQRFANSERDLQILANSLKPLSSFMVKLDCSFFANP